MSPKACSSLNIWQPGCVSWLSCVGRGPLFAKYSHRCRKAVTYLEGYFKARTHFSRNVLDGPPEKRISLWQNSSKFRLLYKSRYVILCVDNNTKDEESCVFVFEFPTAVWSSKASWKYRVFQKEFYIFERLYKFIQRTCTVFWNVII
jgi:hypothetical protein